MVVTWCPDRSRLLRAYWFSVPANTDKAVSRSFPSPPQIFLDQWKSIIGSNVGRDMAMSELGLLPDEVTGKFRSRSYLKGVMGAIMQTYY